MKSFLSLLKTTFVLMVLNQFVSAQSLSGGGFHSLILCSDGTVMSWGRNANGQLGTGNYNDSSTPQVVVNLTNVIAVSGGGLHSMALKSDSTVWTWGMNTSGQLGNGFTSTTNIPVQVVGLNGVIAIAAGGVHSLALKADGTVWAWGSNFYGRLGNGTNTDSNVPVPVSILTNVIGIAGAGFHSIALRNDSTVWTWGYNNYGQLGTGNNTNSNVPVQVVGLTDVTSIAGSNRYYSVALKSDSTVWSWGYNEYGQLGNGTYTTASYTPVQALGLSNVLAVEAGEYFTLALKSDSTVWTWGRNDVYQLGNGTSADSSQPGQVIGLSGVVTIPRGEFYEHGFAMKSDGSIWSWGSGFYGQFANGTTGFSNTPVQGSGFCAFTVDVPQIQKQQGLTIYPNPSKEAIKVVIENQVVNNCQLEIFNALGKKIVSDLSYHSGDLINVSNFAKGIYFVQIHVDGFVHQQKLLIE